MKVCIAEKPSVAREIAAIVGANQKHDGYMEGNGYQVTWTFGHLCTLKEPHEYAGEWKSWSLKYLPMIPPRFGIVAGVAVELFGGSPCQNQEPLKPRPGRGLPRHSVAV